MIYIIPNRLEHEKIHSERFFKFMHNNIAIIEIEMALCKRLSNIKYR